MSSTVQPCSSALQRNSLRFSADEQQRRWKLLLEAILNDPGTPASAHTPQETKEKPQREAEAGN